MAEQEPGRGRGAAPRPRPRLAVRLGGPATGGDAYRVEAPDRVLRVWSLLNAASDELHLVEVPLESLPGLRNVFATATAELERSVSPALAGELQQFINWGDDSLSIDELRIQCAGLLGWVGGLVLGILRQLEEAKGAPESMGTAAALGRGIRVTDPRRQALGAA